MIPGTAAIGLGIATIAASQLLKNFGGARAEGGPVSGNKTYLVGERGPELFVPNVAGTIVPNDELPSFGQGLADQSDFYALPIMTHDVDLSAGAVSVFGESANQNYLVVYQTVDNSAWTVLPASNLKGNGNEYFYITGSYRAA